MTRPRFQAAIFSVFLFSALAGCPKKETAPQGPPQALLEEMAAARSSIVAAEELRPAPEQSAPYRSAMAQADESLAAGEYGKAMTAARRARLEAEKLRAKMLYAELEKLSPSTSLTYHYRDQMDRAQRAEAAGDLAGAAAAASEARRQAELALEYQRRCLKECRDALQGLKDEIELIYRVDIMVIRAYWQAAGAIGGNDCDRGKSTLNKLRSLTDQDKASKVYKNKTFTVQADAEYIRLYGNPAMYKEVTEQGLAGEVARVRPGQNVVFVKSLLFSPEKNYYFVTDQFNGLSGWMAEERVWPERAKEMKGQ